MASINIHGGIEKVSVDQVDNTTWVTFVSGRGDQVSIFMDNLDNIEYLADAMIHKVRNYKKSLLEDIQS